MLELCDRPWAVTFVVGYATYTQAVGEKHAFCIALDKVVEEVPELEQLLVLRDANAHSGWKGGRGKAWE